MHRSIRTIASVVLRDHRHRNQLCLHLAGRMF
jgi:hypothetical protein